MAKNMLIESSSNTKETKTNDLDVKKLKKELKDYVDEEIKKGIYSEIDKGNKRLIKEKNRKIITRDIIIIILLAAIGGLLFLLYDNDYFDRYFNNDKKETKEVVNKEEKKEEEKEKKPTLDELKEKYANYLDRYYVSENNDYLEDFYKGELTEEIKKVMTLNNIDLGRYEEDDYNIIDNDEVEKEYNYLFDTKYSAKSFKYNEKDVKYITKLDSYITDEKIEKKENNIKREIIKIEEESDNILITTVEGKVVDNKIYNVFKDDEIGEYKDNLKDYEDKLNTITYIFDKNKKLIKIERKAD